MHVRDLQVGQVIYSSQPRPHSPTVPYGFMTVVRADLGISASSASTWAKFQLANPTDSATDAYMGTVELRGSELKEMLDKSAVVHTPPAEVPKPAAPGAPKAAPIGTQTIIVTRRQIVETGHGYVATECTHSWTQDAISEDELWQDILNLDNFYGDPNDHDDGRVINVEVFSGYALGFHDQISTEHAKHAHAKKAKEEAARLAALESAHLETQRKEYERLKAIFEP